MPYTLLTPKRTVFGAGALQAAEKEFAALGHKALIVTGNIVRKGEAFAQLQSLLHKLNIAFAVFSDIPAEPDDAMVAAGVAAYQAEGCDHLIGLGGGSPLDTAKAIALGTVARLLSLDASTGEHLGGVLCDPARPAGRGEDVLADGPDRADAWA